MTGIFFLAVTLAWAIAAFFLARWITRPFKSPGVKLFVGILVFPVFFIAPLADEVIGAWQFSTLCKKYAAQVIDEEHAMNRRVVYVPRGPDVYVDGTILPIRLDSIVYRDAATNDVLVSYYTLHASGGWLVRAFGLSETNAPLLFQRGCAPKDQDAFKKKFNITVIN